MRLAYYKAVPCQCLKPVDDPNSRMMTDRSLLDVVQTGHRSLLEQDPIHFRVKFVFLQVAEVDVARLEGHELVVELDVLQVFVEEQPVADPDLT